MPASYFLGSRLLGSTIAYHKWSDTEKMPDSEAFFCPECGEIWGRILESLSCNWHVTIRSCAQHPRYPGEDAAGSFIAPWRKAFEELPPEVLRYETQLRLDRIKDEQNLP